MHFNKKGGYEAANWFYYVILSIFIASFVFVAYLFIINEYKATVIHTNEGLEIDLMMSRFTSSCFTYEDDDILRSYPQIIDRDKFTQENLDNCAQGEIDFKLILYSNNEYHALSTKGWGGEPSKAIEKKVAVFDDGLYNGTLLIEVEDA